MNIKQPLELARTHDACVLGKPRLTVVMLHGIASDSTTFCNTLKYLEEAPTLSDVRFVTFDLLGSGESCKDDELEYNYTEQLTALEQSISKLGAETPLIILGHSMGTLIATRYAATHKKTVRRLILCSPPVYTEENLADPAFTAALEVFRQAVSAKDPSILKTKAFNGLMKQIVQDRKNYKTLATLTMPATLIYGKDDQFIAAFNIPRVLKENAKYLTACETEGRHGMSREKYDKVREILEEELNG